MWGEDTSLNPSSNSQYIELYNPGGQYKTIADKDETPDINEALTLIFYAPNEFDAIPAVDAAGDLATGLTDRIGTLDADGDYWSPTRQRSKRSVRYSRPQVPKVNSQPDVVLLWMQCQSSRCIV